MTKVIIIILVLFLITLHYILEMEGQCYYCKKWTDPGPWYKLLLRCPHCKRRW